MNKFYMFLIVLLVGNTISAQAPFTTLAMEPRVITRTAQGEKYMMKSISEYDADSDTLLVSENNSVFEEIDFFRNNSLSLSLIKEGDHRMSISSEVLFYKIYIFSPTNENLKNNYRFNIPFMIISKLSNTYDNENASTALDMLDYEAAPLTMRIMPSFKLSKNQSFKEKLLGGFYVDGRLINLYNPTNQDYTLEMIAAAGIGLTFQGDGEAGSYSPSGDYENGKWSFSAILQGATANKHIVSNLFITEEGEEMVMSFQSYFLFKVGKNHAFNLKMGYMHLFQESISGTKNTFSLAIGI